MLCYSVPRHAVPYYAGLRSAVPCHATPRQFSLCIANCVMPCYIGLTMYHAMRFALCDSMLRYGMLRHSLQYWASSHNALTYYPMLS